MKKKILNINEKSGSAAFLPIPQSDQSNSLPQNADAIQTNQRRKKILKTFFLLLGLGFLYFLWLQITHLSIPCIFRTITGFLCPGCGITTLILSLAELDFQKAFHANPFLFLTSPLLLTELLYFFSLQWMGKKLPKWNETFVILYGIALCVFGFCRNL